MSTLCPPLDVTTTEAATTIKTFDQCSCKEEIEELHKFNRDLEIQLEVLQETCVEHNRKTEQLGEKIKHQNREIEQFQQPNEQLIKKNSAIEKRLLEVETKLLEIGSVPCSN